ncbi:COG3014 family protein [Motilimonas sp. KMU-193]|uniref:COG3014 family protein n=1 Tax=Motilimonas sp. KMU-193 TaxID=3388668 RepID=UPI00396B1DCD
MRLFRLVFTLVVAGGLAGCSSTSLRNLFIPYNEQMQPARTLVAQGQFSQAAALIEVEEPNQHNYVLSQLEQGRAFFLAGDYRQSLASFKAADEVIKTDDKAAEYRLSQGLNQLGTAITNDNLLRYELPLYERVFLHHYLILNYLALGQYESALVEVRRANLAQQKALDEHSDELRAVLEDANEQGIAADMDAALNGYPDMSGLVGEVQQGYQNGYTFVLSALAYEGAGEYNSAYIDYKRALQLTPHNPFIQQRVWQLAQQLDMQDDLAIFKAAFSTTITQAPAISDTRVILLVEQGLVPAKQQMHLPVPIRSSDGYYGVFNVALPVYPNDYVETSGLISYNGAPVQPSLIAHVFPLAAKQLQQDLPAILVRQAIRTFSKEMMRQQMAKEGGDWGNVLANLYNIATETADTRSWSLLPNSIGVAELAVDSESVQFNIQQGINYKTINLLVTKGKINLVWVSLQGQGIATQVFSL